MAAGFSRAVVLAALLATGAWAVQEFPDCTKAPLSKNQVCDTSLSPWARASALVAAMSQSEKIANTEAESPGVSKLGLPAYTWWNEALHGVARSRGVKFSNSGQFSYATSFPQPIVMGAAFDMELIRKVAETISTEARAFSNGGHCGLNFWTPNINPYRDPRWGRGQEVPSEDPFFISQYVKQLIPGLQGGLEPQGKYWKLVATCKHYLGYDIENWQNNKRYGFNAVVSPSDLRDFYLPPFQSCARDANAQSVMCAYNAVNGVPSCADPYFLQTVLREHWSWGLNTSTQWVTADCDALRNVFSDHKYKNLNAAGVAAATMNAGTDLDCGDFWPQNLGSAVGKQVDVKKLDETLIRRYASLVTLGYFDPPDGQPYRQIGWKDVATPDARALALQAASEGLVLLKNNGAQLLKSSTHSLGPMASATTSMQGNYYGIAQKVVAPIAAFKAAGFTVTTDTSAAKSADAVVYVGGIDTGTETEEKDRNDIDWPSSQLSAIKSLATTAKDKPFVVVQMGTMVDSTWIRDSDAVGALLWAGYPGQDGGTAIVDVITGKTPPAGRLPVTQYPASYTRDVKMTDMGLKPSGSNPGRTYKWFSKEPVFQFAHGLHYTNFSATISTSSLSSNFTTKVLIGNAVGAKYLDLLPFVSLPVSVQNTGTVTSDYVVLAFLKGEYGQKPYPNKSLIGFKRLKSIPGGKTSSTTLGIDLGAISRSDEKGNLVLWPGSYSVEIDVDGKDKWSFTITGDQVTLDQMPAKPS
ncbi:glycoside hydrolase family 3 protein [Thozetella sp. PMI_491]|nr:glycoside hydrolase family 3 protein [Thozetella sp. PMI_491]